ncbi:MAG TPA: LPS assembly protein LptD [Desulfosalsimonadaceae bacterium]|nr:LPS assembly protein LptD [Desulfosalsimonadaceae bacterium]
MLHIPRAINKAIGCFFSIAALMLLCPGQTWGLAVSGQDTSRPAWTIHADRLVYEKERDLYKAFGNVVVQKGETTLSADTVRLDRSSMEAVATGHVRLETREDFISGSRITFNLDSRKGSVVDGTIFIAEKNFYIRGEKIEKTGQSSYAIHHGSFTTCDGQNPDWKVTGRELTLDIGGYGTVKHAALWARKVPLAYTPYFVFPAKRDRQSGFLAPEAGYSDKNGLSWIQPYYWAIDRSCDATFYYHHLEKRGEKLGMEFRYALGPQSRGTLMIDGMHDDKTDEGGEADEQWAYRGDNYTRPNSDRYWFRMKADQQLPAGLAAQLDLDIVSDQDYLREFDDGMTGFDYSNEYFESAFDRDLDDEDDPVRENRLNLNRIWSQYSFNTDVLWYDDVRKRRWEDKDTTLQELPSITFDALKQPLAASPLYFEAASEYNYFYRKDGTTGHRVDIHPRFSLPLNMGPYLTFEPTAGLRQTSWLVDPEKETPRAVELDDNDQHRTFYDLGAAVSTDLSRVYREGEPDAIPIKHTIIPELRYEYIPDTDQSEYPEFDTIDRIEDANRLTLSLTNLLTSKYYPASPAADASGETKSPARPRYNRFFRFNLEQAYNFNHGREPETEPFAPLYLELDLTPQNLLSLRAEAQWSHEQNCLLSHLLSGRLHNARGDSLRMEYRYYKDVRESINLGASLQVTNRIRISGEYERNLEEAVEIEKRLQCIYQSQCWSVGLSYADEGDDQEISAIIRLHGLGGFGEAG